MTAFQWTAQLVTEALKLPRATWQRSYAGISTDSRSLREGELFVALKGERFDAHEFLGDVRAAGAAGAVVRKDTPRWPGFDWYEVDDTLVALGDLARLRRDKFTGIVLALTGTVGKTSTRELLVAALAPLGAVHRSEQNLNNLVGVPLTVLAAPEEARAMVVECGASLRGEIPRMREIVRPDIAIVTAVDAGHLEGFGSMEAVLVEKTALLAGAKVAVVGTQPPELAGRARSLAARLVVAGLDEGADWRADDVAVGADGRARFAVRRENTVRVELPVPGRHMVANALIALAAADAAGVKLADAAAALRGAALPGGRSEIVELGGVTVINDCYNSNPASLRAALDLLNAVRGERRAVVVVGTMRELGSESARLHREAAERVLEAHPDLVVAIGEFARAFESLKGRIGKKRLITGKDPADVAERLRQRLQPGDVVLLKASRGVALERIIPLVWPEAAHGEGKGEAHG
jgi:UDP-N-acetylmuramoyl-tripeptide--D-alanyl-D-alanine ligase